MDVLNLFNAINFNPVISTSTNTDAYRVTSSYSDVNGTFDHRIVDGYHAGVIARECRALLEDPDRLDATA